MQRETYLEHQTHRLAASLKRLPEDFCARHAAYLQRSQNTDGGFSGRDGGSELYYTGFALRALAVLNALTPEVCDRAAVFLRHSLTQPVSVIDFFSLLYACRLVQAAGGPDALAGSPADWPDRVAAALGTFRTPDEGYAKAAGTSAGSTYHTFLVALCYELLGFPLPRQAGVARFIRSRHRDDGGFVEIAPMRRSGTNPTAAAVGILQMLGLDELTREEREGVASFLTAMASPEGGLQANARAPLADLLSTFTGFWTLDQLNGLDRVDAGAGLEYAWSLEWPAGGFRGGLWDDGTDVEYTLYGLGVLALFT
jgi:geranylgeranyl transferase type-2 subunit beta